jgi:hypothetical protein
VRDQHQPVYEFLRSLQPFINKSNEWLATLNDLTVQGKHLDLVPQKRTEQRVGVTDEVEIWVSFEIQGYGVDAASFAGEICRKVRHSAYEMSNTFGLS